MKKRRKHLAAFALTAALAAELAACGSSGRGNETG